MRTPRYSVVIAAFNAGRTIASAVASTLTQTESDLEVIVVDDGSSDGTAEVVERIRDSRVRLLSQVNNGPAAARNTGVAAARGRYVSFLDSDDLWLPSYLARAGSALDQALRPGFAYTDAYAFDSTSGRVRRRTAMELMRPPTPPPAECDRFLVELLRRNFVYTSTTVPRTVLEDVGGYDESMLGAEDYELWLRIVARGYRPVWIPGQHALYRIHSGQLSRDRLRMTRECAAMFRSLSFDAMPVPQREVVIRRRRETERELRIATRDDRVRWAVRQLRHALGRVRQRVGLGDSWYDPPPVEVATAFPDLRAV